jgi:WD repeat-containing protein 35
VRGFDHAFKYATSVNHPKIWRVIAETALIQFEFATAQKCYIQCQDYSSLQFIKKIEKVKNDTTKTAEILAFLNQFGYLTTDLIKRKKLC